MFCLSGFSSWVYCFTTFISPLLSLTTRFATAGTMHLLYYSFVLFLASAFLLRSTTFSFSRSHGSAHHTSPHHTASQQYSCLHCTTFAAFLLFTRSRTLRFRSLFLFFCLFFCLATLNSTPILQPSLRALSTSAYSPSSSFCCTMRSGRYSQP